MSSSSSSSVYGAILCAGYGSRMRPFTDVLPKPLLPFLNTPLITYALHHLASASISTVGINICHLADTIPPVVNPIAAMLGLQPVYAREWEMMGTAGGIRGIRDALMLHDEAFAKGGDDEALLVVMNGDSVMNLDLATHIEAHRNQDASVSLLVRPRAENQPGSVWIDREKGIVVRIREHKHPLYDEASPHLAEEFDFAGVHLIDASLIDRLKLDPGDIITELYGPMIEAGEAVHASITTDFWAAIDNPELYMETTRQCLDDPTLFAQSPAAQASHKGLAILDGNAIDDAAQFSAPVFTGAQIAIAANAKIGPHVVLDGVEVAPDTRISNAVLYGMGSIEGEWSDCVAMLGKVKAISKPTS